MDDYQKFELLGRKQLAIDEGIKLMEQIKIDLQKDASSADTWGLIAVTAQAVLVPLNVIVNAFPAPVPKNNYQKIVKAILDIYKATKDQQGNVKAVQDGDMAGKIVKEGIKAIKKGVEEQLTAKGMAEYVPGLKIMVGLAEDSHTLFKTAMMFDQGRTELKERLSQLQRKIDAANHQIRQLGLTRANLLENMQRRSSLA